MTIDDLLTLIRALTPGQAADVLCALDPGMSLWHERKGIEAPTAKKGPGRPKKAATAAAPVAVAPVVADTDGAPAATAYRLLSSAIDHSVCVGRSLGDATHDCRDRRWKPIIFREMQCGGARADGSDLCSKCHRRCEKASSGADPAKTGWNGRVTEAPPAWTRMLGTEWAERTQPKWLGVAPAEDAASVGSADSGSVKEEMPAATETPAASKSAKLTEKVAAKAAAKAAKEAEKVAAKAAKEAEKAAAKSAKEAEKAAAKSAKEAEKAAAKPKKAPKAAATEATAPAKAATAAAVQTASELKLIDGTLYTIKNGNVYEYDELTEATGDFVGRLGADGESIDTDADEVASDEEN